MDPKQRYCKSGNFREGFILATLPIGIGKVLRK